MMHKNMLLLEFSNLGHPFLRVTAPSGSDSISFVLDLTNQPLTTGHITDIDPIVKRMMQECPQRLPIQLNISCGEIFRRRFMLPKMSALRAHRLYRKEHHADQHASNHHIWEEHFTYSGGHVFDRYYIPRDITAPFYTLANQLGVALSEIKPMGVTLMSKLHFNGCFAYFYIRRNVCTLLLCDSGRLLTSYDFSFKTVDEIRRTFLIVAGKYEMELDNHLITHYGVTSDIPFSLDLGLLPLQEEAEVQL